MKRLFGILIVWFLLCVSTIAADFYGATSLTGGVAGALDYIDGDNLLDGDGAFVITDGTSYQYRLDATSGAAQLSPRIIAPDTNPGTKRWVLNTDNMTVGSRLNVKIYGAVGDGVTDDTSAIQACVDAAILVNGVVVFPPGTYIVTTTITVALPGHLYIVGNCATIKQEDNANLTEILILQGGSQKYITTNGLTVDGNMANNTAVTAVKILNLSSVSEPLGITAINADVGVAITGNTEKMKFDLSVYNCTVGVYVYSGVDLYTSDENMIFINGHSCGTFYKVDGTNGKCSAVVHISAEIASANAIHLISTNYTVLTGEIRGCASNGLVIEGTGSYCLINTLMLIGMDTGWGLLCDNASRLRGKVFLMSFAGGAWIKEAVYGELELYAGSIDSLAALRLGEEGVTSVQRFTTLPGSMFYTDGTNAIHFEDTYSCVVNAQYLASGTNDILFDDNSRNDTVIINGRSITATKFVSTGTSPRVDVIGQEHLESFANVDATPSVLGMGETVLSGVSTETIDAFYDGYYGQPLTVISKAAITFSTSAANRLIGSSANIVTASGDVTKWVCETPGTTASVWRLVGFVDVSADNSGGA